MQQQNLRNDKSLTFYVRTRSKFETLMRNPKNSEKHKKHRTTNINRTTENTQKIERNDKNLTFCVRSRSKFKTLMRNPKNNEKHKKHRTTNINKTAENAPKN